MPEVDAGFIFQLFSVLYIEAGSLNRIQSSPIGLV